MKLLILCWQVVGGNINGYTYFLQAGYFWSYWKFLLVILIVFTCRLCLYMILNYVFFPWHKRCWLFFLVNSKLRNFPYMSIVLEFYPNFFFFGKYCLIHWLPVSFTSPKASMLPHYPCLVFLFFFVFPLLFINGLLKSFIYLFEFKLSILWWLLLIIKQRN